MSETDQTQTLEQIKALLETRSNVDKTMHHDDAVCRAEELRNHYQVLTEVNNFKSGQLVKWKPSLRNKSKPMYNEPAIVVDVLDEPILGENKETGSAYFREPLDLILGFLDDENLVLFHFDKRRFELYTD